MGSLEAGATVDHNDGDDEGMPELMDCEDEGLDAHLEDYLASKQAEGNFAAFAASCLDEEDLPPELADDGNSSDDDEAKNGAARAGVAQPIRPRTTSLRPLTECMPPREFEVLPRRRTDDAASRGDHSFTPAQLRNLEHEK